MALRLGIVTCSELDTLLVNGKGEVGLGAGAQFTYMDTLIGERITGEAADPFTGNRHTERGHELEGTGRQLFGSSNRRYHPAGRHHPQPRHRLFA